MVLHGAGANRKPSQNFRQQVEWFVAAAYRVQWEGVGGASDCQRMA